MFVSGSDIFAAARKAQEANMIALANVALESLNKVTELNLQAAKTMLVGQQQGVAAVLSGKDLREFFAAQNPLAEPAIDKALAYARHFQEIAAGTQVEFQKVVDQQSEQHRRSAQAFVDQISEHAPAGSETMIALMQSTLAAANRTYDAVQDATKQAAEAARANFTAGVQRTRAAK